MNTDQYLKLVVEQLKQKKNLPFKIRKRRCPERNPKCRKYHGEVVVQSYDQTSNKFHLVYYGIHELGKIFEYDKPPEIVKGFLIKSIRRRIMKLRDLKKMFDLDLFLRTKLLIVRMTDMEFKIVQNDASRKKVKVSDYVRSVLLDV